MPTEQTTGPVLSSVTGWASKQVSNGSLLLSAKIEGDPALGWPPEEELNALLLEAFAAIGAVGWQGMVTKHYISTSTLAPTPDPAEPAP